MAKPKKPARRQGKKSTKGVRVRDLPAKGRLAEKIKGGAIPSMGLKITPKIDS
jgi:hypothetical protein